MSANTQQGWNEAKIESIEKQIDKIAEALDRLARVEEKNQSNQEAIKTISSDLESIKSKMWVVNIMGSIFIAAALFFANQSFQMIDAAKRSPQLTAEQIAEIVIKVNSQTERKNNEKKH